MLDIGFAKYLQFTDLLPQQKAINKLISLKIERTTLDAKTVIFSPYEEGNKLQERNLYFLKEGTAKFYLPRS